jgi:hypothetical protein
MRRYVRIGQQRISDAKNWVSGKVSMQAAAFGKEF